MVRMIDMAGSNCDCGGPGLEVISTQDLRDLFMIFSSSTELSGPGRDKQLGMLMAIREELKRRVDECQKSP